jgi:phosphatidylglycerol:prolipoprotein diacylglycerol transferase
MLGVIIGGRFGYALFYNFGYYFQHPLEIILPFDFSHGFKFVGISGMSYHGGLIGVVIVFILFCRKHKINFWHFGDLFCPAIPLGYTFGRIGNFINGELFGRVTTVPWGMYFPLDSTHSLRHPSQLYEALFEGIVLFILLWLIRKKKMFDGFLVGIYIFSYGFVRFFIEFFREPDYQLGFVLGFMSMGQVLCLLMMAAGMTILIWRKNAQIK